jgi:uncharacterized OsmC-like protein
MKCVAIYELLSKRYKKMKLQTTLTVNAQCSSHSRADVQIGNLQLIIDEPVERGGTDAGPTPTNTAISALVGCTNVIAHKCAKKLGIDIGKLSISAACEFDRRGVTLTEEVNLPFIKIKLEIKSSKKIDQVALQSVARDVAKYCPLTKLFAQAGTEIESTWI